jgi:hypothetical protein
MQQISLMWQQWLVPTARCELSVEVISFLFPVVD